MKIFTQSMYIFCSETVRLFPKEVDIFYVEDPRKFQTRFVRTIAISSPVGKQSFLMFFLVILIPGIQRINIVCQKNLQYISCRDRVENVQLIFFYIEDCVAASINISLFFKERAAASKKILRKTTVSEIY